MKFKPVGIVKYGYEDKTLAPRQGFLDIKVSVIKIYKEYLVAANDFSVGDFIQTIYFANKADRDSLEVYPYGKNDIKGVFSTRSPNRPNPLSICVCKIVNIENDEIFVRGLDALEGSEILDIKFYSEEFHNQIIENKNNDFLELCNKRRSYRKFTDEKISDWDLKYILEAALLSPTSKNSDSKRYIVVRNKELLLKLSAFKEKNATFLKDASVGIVVLTDKEKAKASASQDACITATHIMLAAEDRGLGSCWANVLLQKNKDGEFGYKVIKKLLDIPEKYNVECVIGIGHKGEIPRKKRRLNLEEHVEFRN